MSTARSPRRHAGNPELDYQALEPKNLLATTLYVDFGFGDSSLQITNSQSAALNGPQIFGDAGTSLESFLTVASGMGVDPPDVNYDFNFDGIASTSQDAEALADQVMQHLDSIFSVFDVNLQRTNSSDADAEIVVSRMPFLPQ